MKNKNKFCFALLTLSLLFSTFGISALNNNVFANAETFTVNGDENGLLIETSVDKESKSASFEYWNYLDYETVKTSELFTIAMMPETQTVAEASNMVVSLYDAVDENQCLSIIINTGTKYYNMESTYGQVSFWDDFTIATNGSVTIKGTDQTVVGCRQLVDGAYSSHGAIDIIGWKETTTGFFSANGEGDFFPLTPVTLGFNGTVVSSVAHRNDAQKVGEYKRDIANLLHNDFLSKSINYLSAQQHEEIVNRYTEEYVNSLFSSGKIKVKITFGGCTGEKVSFRLNSIAGETVSEREDNSNPFVILPLTTQAIKGKEYTLPVPIIYDNVDEINEYSVDVFNPSGNEVVVTNNKFAVEEEGTYVVRYTTVDNAGNIGVNEYEIISYGKTPEITFTQISENTLQAEHKVYDYITIPAFEATSLISRAERNKMAVSVVLTIDGKIQTEFKDATKENVLQLTESGQAQLIYFATNEYGMVRSYTAYAFEIVDVPLILLNEQYTVEKTGSEYVVPTNYCYYVGNKYKANVTITAPDGSVVTPVKNRFVLSQIGVYALTYSYTVGGMQASAVMEVESVVKASQLFQTNNPTATMEDNVDFPEYAKEQKSGLFLSAKDETTFTYKNTIDLNELSEQDALLQFLSYSDDTHGKFYGIVTLTDVEDATKKIVLTIKPHGSMWQYSYIHVNYDGRTLARNAENGGKISTSDSYGSLMQIPMGTGQGHANVQQFRLSFNYADKAFYITSNIQTDPWLLLDMDNSEHVGAGRGWEGFTSGKVTMSFTLRKMLNGTADNMGVILTAIAGQSLEGEKVIDETAPAIYFENTNTLKIDKNTTVLPVAEKGKNYKLPKATAYDVVDGAVSVRYALKKAGGSENLYVNENHTFTEAGEYVYTVETNDVAGNVEVRTFAITVVEEVEKIQIELSSYDSDSVYAFEYFYLPQINITGGSGEVVASYEITLNGKAITVDKLGRVLPNEAGTISIKFTINDYIGTAIEGESEFLITVHAKSTPVAKIGEKPVALIVGQNNRFFSFEALSYGANGVTDVSYKAIKVGGEIIWETDNGSQTGSLIYFLENTTETFKNVQYLAGENKESASVIYEYNIPVQKFTFVSDLLIAYDYDASCTMQTITSVDRTQKGTNYIFSGNKGLRLVSGVTADGLVLRFNGLAENYVGQTVVFRLTDVTNPEISVVVKIWHEGETAYMVVNPALAGRIPEKVDGKLNNINEYFYFEYDEQEKKLINAQGSLVAQIKDCENGTVFNGFPSGAVNVSFEVETSETCGLNIYQISNQLFLTADSETEYVDILGAQISLNGAIPVAIMSKGQTITLPSAVAYDVATGKADVKLTVTLDGFPVAGLNNVSADKAYSLTFDALGNYGIIYTSTDLNGKKSSLSYAISVKDTKAPNIQVNGNINQEYKLGDKLSIPNFEVTDDSGASTTFVWLELPNGELKNITADSEWTLTISGSYNLIIAAFDAENNYTWVEYTFIVK